MKCALVEGVVTNREGRLLSSAGREYLGAGHVWLSRSKAVYSAGKASDERYALHPSPKKNDP